MSLTVFSMGDGVMSLLDVFTNELEAKCSRWVGEINEKSGGEERTMTIGRMVLSQWRERWSYNKRNPIKEGQCPTPWSWSKRMGEVFA